MNYFVDKNGTRTTIPGNSNDKFIPLPDGDISKQLEHIAASLEAKVKLAKKQAEAAKNTAFWSKVFSVISISIALGSLIVAILALALR